MLWHSFGSKAFYTVADIWDKHIHEMADVVHIIVNPIETKNSPAKQTGNSVHYAEGIL